jgi:hypothetical protein
MGPGGPIAPANRSLDIATPPTGRFAAMHRLFSALAEAAKPDREPGALVRTRWLAWAIGVGLVGATLRPVIENWREKPRDGFPFSYYPMFSAKRQRHVEVTHLIGITARGTRHVIPATVAGTGGLNQIRKQIRRTVREGRAQELAASVADTLRTHGLDEFERVAVVTGRFDMHAFYAGDRRPVALTVHAVEPVRRRAPD